MLIRSSFLDSDESSSETLRALLGTLKKARNFVQEQVAQAELNDKLKTSIQLHYEQVAISSQKLVLTDFAEKDYGRITQERVGGQNIRSKIGT